MEEMCRNSNFSPSPFPTPHSWKHKTFPQHLTCPGPSTAQAGIANSRCLCSATRPPGLLRFLFWVWEGDGLDPGYLWSSSIAAPPGYPLGRLRWASRWLRRSVSPAPGPLGRPGPGRGCVRVRLPHPPRGRNKGWGAAEHTGGGSAIRPSPPELATSAARDGAAGCGPRAAGGRRGRARGPARPAPLPGFCLRAPGGSNLARPRPLALSSARRALGGPAPHSAAAARRQ